MDNSDWMEQTPHTKKNTSPKADTESHPRLLASACYVEIKEQVSEARGMLLTAYNAAKADTIIWSERL